MADNNELWTAVRAPASTIGRRLAERFPADHSAGHPMIPAEAAEPIADTITMVVAEILQAWLDAGSERDVTLEELGPSILAHVRDWAVPLTKDQVLEAIEQLKSLCDGKMQNYEMISVRSGLYELGYGQEQADVVVRALELAGFTNCCDPMVAVKNVDGGKDEYPSEQVCYWGPDQLKSRLYGYTIR